MTRTRAKVPSTSRFLAGVLSVVLPLGVLMAAPQPPQAKNSTTARSAPEKPATGTKAKSPAKAKLPAPRRAAPEADALPGESEDSPSVPNEPAPSEPEVEATEATDPPANEEGPPPRPATTPEMTESETGEGNFDDLDVVPVMKPEGTPLPADQARIYESQIANYRFLVESSQRLAEHWQNVALGNSITRAGPGAPEPEDIGYARASVDPTRAAPGDINYPKWTPGVVARRVHVVLCSNTLDGTIGEGAKANHAKLKALLKRVTGSDAVEVRDNGFTFANIGSRIAALDVKPCDVVFCYVSTHGAIDSQRRHFMQDRARPSKTQMRSTLLKQLTDKGGRLTVLITDSCAIHPAPLPPAPLRRAAPPVLPYPLWDLLWEFEGVVDINACSPNVGPTGEYSYYINENSSRGGGVFTDVFYQASIHWKAPVRRLDWNSFFAELVNNTPRPPLSVLKLGDPTTQTPFWFPH